MKRTLQSATIRRARRAAGYAIILLGLVCLSPQVATAQCAMCRRALQSPEGQQMIAAFRSGILFLLIAPFAVFAIVATLAVRARQRRINTKDALPERVPTALGKYREEVLSTHGGHQPVKESFGAEKALARS